MIVAFSTIAVTLTYFLARPAGRSIAILTTLIVAVSPGVIELSHWELSDVPFWAFTTGALLLWSRAGSRASLPGTVGASFLTACAYAIRTAGLPLLVASTAWLALRRRYAHLALHLIVVVPPALAWWLWSGRQDGYTSQILSVDPYTSSAATLTIASGASRVFENAVSYTTTFLPTLFAGSTHHALLLISIPLIVFALAGWASRLGASTLGVPEIFFPLYGGILLLWLPQLGGERLLLPLYPLVLIYSALGVKLVAGRLRASLRSTVPAVAAAVMILAAIPANMGAARSGTACTSLYREGDRYACLEPAWKDFFMLAEYTRDALPQRSAILSRKPALVFATAGHPGRTYPFVRSPDSLIAAAAGGDIRYLLLDNLDEISTTYLTPALIQRPGAFCVIRSLGPDRATLFGIAGGASTIRDERPDPGAADVAVSFQRCGPEYWRHPELRDSAMARP